MARVVKHHKTPQGSRRRNVVQVLILAAVRERAQRAGRP